MISRGFISPEKSALIASDHRVFGITEKSATGDGSVDRDLILEMGTRYARTFIHFDMSEIVQRHGTVISAALLGAIAGSGALPFSFDCFRDLISEGSGAQANRWVSVGSRALLNCHTHFKKWPITVLIG